MHVAARLTVETQSVLQKIGESALEVDRQNRRGRENC
jgi:hypothetical protein